jgi:DNA segregation ATPase FtsK/SpoIIIE-like protein
MPQITAGFPVSSCHCRHPQYRAALAYVRDTRSASISGVHRAIRCGYGAANRMLDAMERHGVIRKARGQTLRDVLPPLALP